MKPTDFVFVACMLASAFVSNAQHTDDSANQADKEEARPRLFEKLYLGQSEPNPVNVHQSITIPFRSIAADEAKIIVFNDDGEPVITFEDLEGKENVIIDGGRLPAGNYRYYLLVSGRVVKRKKLQITE